MGSNLPIHPQAFSMLAAMLGWEGSGCLLGGALAVLTLSSPAVLPKHASHLPVCHR